MLIYYYQYLLSTAENLNTANGYVGVAEEHPLDPRAAWQ